MRKPRSGGFYEILTLYQIALTLIALPVLVPVYLLGAMNLALIGVAVLVMAMLVACGFYGDFAIWERILASGLGLFVTLNLLVGAIIGERWLHTRGRCSCFELVDIKHDDQADVIRTATGNRAP